MKNRTYHSLYHSPKNEYSWIKGMLICIKGESLRNSYLYYISKLI